MEKSGRNKENVASIANMFKVKKCLFDPTFRNKNVESNSPNSGQQCHTLSPVAESFAPENSPYSLFKIRKKKSHKIRLPPYNDSPYGSVPTTPTNKKYLWSNEEMGNSPVAENLTDVKLAIQKSLLNPDLIGDFTKPCALPTINGKHPDLKTVSPDTVASLLNGSASMSFTLIDCRYPYEFSGGHIKNAHNIFVKDAIVKHLLNESKTFEKCDTKEVLIFYCEFSSERGPKMLRHLRNIDRDMNSDCYPFLYYPELYIMEGGYNAFFENFKEFCDPPQYRRMLDDECTEQLAHYRSMCKPSGRRSRGMRKSRSALMF